MEPRSRPVVQAVSGEAGQPPHTRQATITPVQPSPVRYLPLEQAVLSRGGGVVVLIFPAGV